MILPINSCCIIQIYISYPPDYIDNNINHDNVGDSANVSMVTDYNDSDSYDSDE